MSKSHGRMLGIAVGERSMLIAEVAASGDGWGVARAREFTYPSGQSLSDTQALGTSLGQFLRDQDFSSRSAVFGIPAKWVVARKKDVPPCDPYLAADMLRLQAEGEFPPELNDIVFDYSGEVSSSSATNVLLLALPRKYLEQLSKLAEAAKVKAVAVTPSASALGAAVSRGSDDSMVLLLGPSGAEFASQHGAEPRAIRYVGAATASATLLAGELRRAAAVAPTQAAHLGNGNGKRELVIWNDLGTDDAGLHSLGESIGLAMRDGRLADLGVEAPAANGEGPDFAAPVALALSHLREGPRQVDFLHTRLAPPPKQRVDQRLVLGIAVAALLLFGGIAWYWQLHSEQVQVDTDQKALDTQVDQVKQAKSEVDTRQYAAAWHSIKAPDGSVKTPFLQCYEDLTEATPESRTPRLFATTLTMVDPDASSDTARSSSEPRRVKCTLAGKAADRQVVLDLVYKLKANKRFTDVQPLTTDSKEPNRSGPSEVSFTVAFNYLLPIQ